MSTTALFTLEAYEHMAAVGAFDGKYRKRVELVRGEILEMSPIGAEHAEFVDRLTEWSFKVCAGNPIRVRSQNPIRIPFNESEPEPDIVWVEAKSYSDRHPEPQEVLLLIEVADSSLEYDRGEKLVVYAEAGIAEYWIVNLIDEQIEVYRNPSGRKYQEESAFRGDAAIQPLAPPTATLQPSRLFD